MKLIAPLALLLLPALGRAELFSWVTWDLSTVNTNSVVGSIPTDQGLVSVTLTGPFTSVSNTNDVWNPESTFAGGIVDNRPNTGSFVEIVNAGTYSLSFSRPVEDLAVSIWSLGRSGVNVNFAFDQAPTLAAGGPSASFGGPALTVSGNNVSGQEANGTLVFDAVPQTLTWTADTAESYSGLTLGLANAQPVPEPATMAALGLGAAALLRRRRKA